MFTFIKIYFWKGITDKGKPCKGKALTKNIDLLRSNLRRKGIIIQNIQCRYSLIISQKVKGKDLLFFTRQIARLLRAGLPLVQILELLENSNNPTLQTFISQIRLNIEDGFSLTEALNNQAQPYFSRFYLHLIALGEKTSSLELMLQRIADSMEKNLKIKAKLNVH